MKAVDDRVAPAHPWDDAADGWQRHTGLIRAWLREATVAMIDGAGIAPGHRVLDVAAGAGDQTIDVARRVGPTGVVLATDVSARILELARAAFDAEGLDRIDIRQADAGSLGLEGEGFDAAVCRLGLMFSVEPLRALRGVHGALAPCGRFSALVFGGPEGNPCVATLMRTACRHAAAAAPDPFLPGSLFSLGRPGPLAGLLDQAGFEDVTVTALSAPFRAPNLSVYIDFVRDSGSPVREVLKPLSPEARAQAWADIARQLDRFSTSDGWEGPNELLLCSGVKP